MNRDERRKWEKQFKGKTTKTFATSQGECPFCGDRVYAPEGQAMIFFNGQPTHKACRKAFKRGDVVPTFLS